MVYTQCSNRKEKGTIMASHVQFQVETGTGRRTKRGSKIEKIQPAMKALKAAGPGARLINTHPGQRLTRRQMRAARRLKGVRRSSR